jgi:hypothetical protein
MQIKRQTPSGILRVRHDYFALKNPRPVQIYELNLLGYLAREETLMLTPKGRPCFHLVEIIEADTEGGAGFCLLWHLGTEQGYVLPHPYCYYIEEAQGAYLDDLASIS